MQIYTPPDKAAFHFIVVEKQHQRLTLFRQRGRLETVQTFTCATGENPGTKRASGDARTPEGIYFITEIYEDSKITVFGSRAFHLDYPNVFDLHAGHLGDGIFIHGTNKKLIPYSTNGCITLNNNDLDKLAPYLVVNHLPVIVVHSLGTTPEMAVSLTTENPRFQEILQLLSLENPGIDTDKITTLFFLQVGQQAVVSVQYDGFDGDYLRLSYQKRSYLVPGQTTEWRSLQSVHSQELHPLILAKQPVKHHNLPIVAAVKTQKPAPVAPIKITIKEPSKEKLQKSGEDLLAFVEKWRTAWETKDINTYMDCYAPDFTSGKLDKQGWRKKKSYLNKKYSYINVTIRNIIVEWTDEGANVSFHQRYASDQFQTSGTKILNLIRENNKWKIHREHM